MQEHVEHLNPEPYTLSSLLPQPVHVLLFSDRALNPKSLAFSRASFGLPGPCRREKEAAIQFSSDSALVLVSLPLEPMSSSFDCTRAAVSADCLPSTLFCDSQLLRFARQVLALSVQGSLAGPDFQTVTESLCSRL